MIMDKQIEKLTRKFLRNKNVCKGVKKILALYLDQDNDYDIKALARGHISWLDEYGLRDEVSSVIDLANGKFQYVYDNALSLCYGNVHDYIRTITIHDRLVSTAVALFDRYGTWIAHKSTSKNVNEWQYEYRLSGDIHINYHYINGITHISHDYRSHSYEYGSGKGSFDYELTTPLDNYHKLLAMSYDELQLFTNAIPHPMQTELPSNWATYERFYKRSGFPKRGF